MELTETLPSNAWKDGATQVADIDGDGQAEIVVSGDTQVQKYASFVRVFKLNGSPWMPTRTRPSPVLHLLMKKDAFIDGVQHNGTYPNPVSMLYTDVIEYTITAVNANLNPADGTLVIRDTLPAYPDYTGTESSPPQASFVPGTANSIPQRSTLEWTFSSVQSLDTV
ncbi:MAG: hypothetical protein LBL07_17830 [Tannerella sp.]|nr:hypothetical protein [Tannerella sp.]